MGSISKINKSIFFAFAVVAFEPGALQQVGMGICYTNG
jgi:hypothetical protein